MAEHELKVWPQFFAPLFYREKTFEVRKNDRDYQVGDGLLLRQYDPEKNDYIGGACHRQVTYVMKGGAFGIDPEYVVLGLK